MKYNSTSLCIFLCLFLVCLFLTPGAATRAWANGSDVVSAKQVLARYLEAKKAYDIESQLDCLTSADRKKIDYLALKRAQPGPLTQAVFSKYARFEIGELNFSEGGHNRATVDMIWVAPDYINIRRRYNAIPQADHLSVMQDVVGELQAAGNQQPTQRQLLQGEIAKIYYGQDLPIKKSHKKYHLQKEADGWKVELIESIWNSGD